MEIQVSLLGGTSIKYLFFKISHFPHKIREFKPSPLMFLSRAETELWEEITTPLLQNGLFPNSLKPEVAR